MGWGLRRKTSRPSEGSELSSRARPWQPSKSKRRARLRRKRSRPSSRMWSHPTLLLTPSTSTSGRPSITSLCCKARSLARRRRSRSFLCHLHQHRRLLRMLRRRPNSMLAHPAGHASSAGPVEAAQGRFQRAKHWPPLGEGAGAGALRTRRRTASQHRPGVPALSRTRECAVAPSFQRQHFALVRR
jgi:hypothetical protein